MILHRVLPQSKRIIQAVVQPGDTVVDATAGNGNDTLFLANLVGETGKVFSFDIQTQAIEKTRERINHASHVQLIQDSHANCHQYIQEPIAAAMFNLGYLPYSEDLSIVTQADSTITALRQLLRQLKTGGIITLSVYDGHEGGPEEREGVLDFVRSLPQADVHVIRYELLNVKNNPPFLLALEKLRDGLF